MQLAQWHDALRKGLGRSLQHVGEMPREAVRPLILDAALRNISYDHQMESRGRWMHEMLVASGEPDWYVPRILAGIPGLRDCYDADQALEVLARCVLAGRAELRPRVHEAFRALHATRRLESFAGRSALLLMDGAEAALAIAQVAGERLLADPDEWEDDGFFGQLDESPGAARIRAQLQGAAPTDPRIAQLLMRIEETSRLRTSEPSEPTTREHVERLLLENRQDDLRLVPFAAAGRNLRSEDAGHFLLRIESESDPGRLERLLFMLSRAPHPEASDRVVELARSAIPGVQSAALDLLAASGDRRGPPLARELLRMQPDALDRGAARVLGPACLASDVPLVLQALEPIEPRIVDPDDVQCVVSELLTLRGAPAGPVLVPVFEWIYERAFCGHCRCEAVEALVQMSGLDGARREECRFDASDDVRDAAR